MATVQDAINYILSCRPAPYTWWLAGPLGEGPPAWSENASAPDPSEVQQGGLFCAAVGNLVRRYLGLEIPYRPSFPSEEWDGGTLAWWEFFYDRSEYFDASKGYPDGTCLLKQYVEGYSQGHWAMVYRGYIIDSTDATGNGRPGLQWEQTVAQSHGWIGYDIAVVPEVWMPVDLVRPDRIRVEPAKPDPIPFTVDLLVKAMPNLHRGDAEHYFPHLVEALKEFEINTRERISAFLGEVGHESGDFYYWEEIDGANQRYEPYYGRGPLQITWLENYDRCGEALGLDLVDDPDLLLLPEHGFRAAGWFWRNGSGDLNPYADEATWSSYDDITLRINGGYIGKEDRDTRYLVAWNALPPGLTLEEPTVPVPPDPPVTPPVTPPVSPPVTPPDKKSPAQRLADLKKRLERLLKMLDEEDLEKVVSEMEKDFNGIVEALGK